MNDGGGVRTISTEFCSGWARVAGGRPAHVHAMLGGRALGGARAADPLRHPAREGAPEQYGFTIVFDEPIAPAEVGDVTVFAAGASDPVSRADGVRLERHMARKIFVLGSARSGTSALGRVLSTMFALAWLGEGHAAPFLAEAARRLTGDPQGKHPLVRLMARYRFRAEIVRLTRLAYFAAHESASFLDKTPGHETIAASPFLAECFPDARFIYLQRNGISNVLSRMKKFGPGFDTACAGWTAAVQAWPVARDALPHCLELRQEDMLGDPEAVAGQLARYLGASEREQALADALRGESLERTGAGVGRRTLAETGWTEQQKAIFLRRCGPAMAANGYPLD